uniref:Cilia- and flagella-associated protein 53 n=1 Tax=Pseudonaja textilis TaxID=8673 RepID=A0A670ZS24_PSETE
MLATLSLGDFNSQNSPASKLESKLAGEFWELKSSRLKVANLDFKIKPNCISFLFRLRDLLETEEKGFIAEMESQEETTESRRNSMRMRAKELREKREEARRKLVAEKRELQFRETCEEVRLLLNQQHMKEVCEDRMSQLALKQELNKQKEMEEAMYNALWEEDRLAKEKRASEEANKRSGWREEMISMLNGQRAIAEAQRQETRRLKEEEAKLMEEERQLIKLEKEQAEIERQRKLRECRDMLLDSMKKKAKRLSEERQDELALEMKILDHVLQESLEDTESQKQRKRELFQEQQAYRAYLAQQREEEKRQEEELDRMRAEDAAKMWAKRAEKERALKLARDRLLKEVMDTRKLQIEEKCNWAIILELDLSLSLCFLETSWIFCSKERCFCEKPCNWGRSSKSLATSSLPGCWLGVA